MSKITEEKYFFTEKDDELLKGLSFRDPLGTQMLWSILGRQVIPHLTEQTRYIEGFQLLLSAFNFYSHFSDWMQKHYEERYKEEFGSRNKKQAFSLENVFILIEQAFAYSFYNKKGDWMLYGKRRLNSEPKLSLYNQILSSQLSTGVWGYYRGAAIRAGILDPSGKKLSPQIAPFINDVFNGRILKPSVYQLITDALKYDKEFTGATLKNYFSEIITELPQKKLLRKYLLRPNDDDTVERLATKLYQFGFNNAKPQDRRNFISSCKTDFPENSEAYENMLRFTDYAGTLDWLFTFLTAWNGETLKNPAIKLNKRVLSSLPQAKNNFKLIKSFVDPASSERSKKYIEKINFDSSEVLLFSIIDLHKWICENRGSKAWLYLDDSGKLVVDSESLIEKESAPDVLPGRGWCYDFYMVPLVEIYKGLK